MHQFGHNYRNVFGLEPGPTTTTSGSFHASSPAAAAQFSNLSGEQQQQQQQQLYDSPSLFQFDSFENNTPSSSSPDPRVFLFSPEQLARHVSSDASSFTSSSPASPLMGGNNNFCAGNGGSSSSFYSLQGNNSNYSTPNSPVFSQFQDVSGGGGVGSPYSTSIDANSPRTVSEEFQSESPKSSGRDYPVVCLHPGCDAKPFKRRADLDRHYKHKHAPASQKEAYYCDYPKCARRRDPFHRRDHFRDHLREFHKEDIEKRGGSVNDEEWLDGRNTSSAWWRCAKCLVRNYVEQSGYDCPICKTTCQAKRKEIRMRD